MPSANRSITLHVPEKVEVSRFCELRKQLVGVLHDEPLEISVHYHPMDSTDADKALGKTKGMFSLDELTAAAQAVSRYLNHLRVPVAFSQCDGHFSVELGLQTA